MRILAVTNLYPPGFQGGYELGCSHVVEALRRGGHEVRVLTSPGAEAANATRVLKLHRVFDPGFMSNLPAADRRALEIRARLFDAANVTALERELTGFTPEVVYLWNLLGIGGLGLVGLLSARGARWVWHLMDAVPRQLCSIDDEPIGLLSQAFEQSTSGRYLVCSSHVLGEIRMGGLELGDRADLLPNWFASDLPPPRRKFYAGGALKIVCAVGVLIEHKGIELLIDAATSLQVSDPGSFGVDLYGAETDERFRKRASGGGLGEVVSFRGILEQAELIGRLADYDVFVFPTDWREPFAFAPLEAAAAGCVPLISATSGNAEWMVGDVHCLKAARSADAFAATLAAIIHGEIDLRPVGRRAQSIVREMFHLPTLLPRIEAVLEETAACAPPQRTDRLLVAAADKARALLEQ